MAWGRLLKLLGHQAPEEAHLVAQVCSQVFEAGALRIFLNHINPTDMPLKRPAHETNQGLSATSMPDKTGNCACNIAQPSLASRQRSRS
jgi:hypothetical protein